ncbi:MAG: RIP metalloprotease RseP [Dehalococcoidia bacterium]
MSFIPTIVIFLSVLTVLVLVHELGHYFCARILGIRVEELGLGFPPRLKAIRSKGIIYSLNYLPLGGFVRLKGESDETIQDGFASRSILQRFLVIFSGPAMNFVLAIILFSFLATVTERIQSAEIVIEAISADSPAESAGMRPGDILTSIGGVNLNEPNDFSRAFDLEPDEATIVVVSRNLETKAFSVIPRSEPPAGEGPIGIELKLLNVVYEEVNVWKSPYYGIMLAWDNTMLIYREIGNWISGSKTPEIAGPVGIAQITGEAAQAGFIPLVYLVAMLSLNLGILNLLPIPALDGGRIPFLVIEFVRGGKRLPANRERLVHAIGFGFLISLIIIVTLGNDIPRLLD